MNSDISYYSRSLARAMLTLVLLPLKSAGLLLPAWPSFVVGAAIALMATGAPAQKLDGLPTYKLDTLPTYQKEKEVKGVIRNYGNEAMEKLVGLWESGFRKHHPNVRFHDNFPSSAVAIGGLYTGVADVAVMGREIWQLETMGFFRVFQSEPLEITVASGAFDVNDKTWGAVVFVHKDNPITKLTLKQLDGIFGAMRTGAWTGVKWHPELARTAEGDIRTWGQLGLTGEWADKPIQTYGYDTTMSATRFNFSRLVLKGSNKWNPNLREYAGGDRLEDVNTRTRVGQQMIPDLAEDKYGIAYTAMQNGRPYFPRVKPIALAAQDGGPYVEPTRENFQNRTYPLVRDVYFYLYREPGKPLDPKLREFLKYVLSREGQQAVAEDGAYLPLTQEMIRQQLAKLE